MLIGMDFDNTIVCYDDVFHRIALEQGLIPPQLPIGKGSVRDYLRQMQREEAWIELQGTVYGSRIEESDPFPGVVEFLARCRQKGMGVCIISHKTRNPFRGPLFDLHQAAHQWLEHHSFFDPSWVGLSRTQVYFELTKEEKLNRIGSSGCTHFIDDLPEFLLEPSFPPQVKRILFDPNGNGSSGQRLRLGDASPQPSGQGRPLARATSWEEVGQMIFGKGVLS